MKRERERYEYRKNSNNKQRIDGGPLGGSGGDLIEIVEGEVEAEEGLDGADHGRNLHEAVVGDAAVRIRERERERRKTKRRKKCLI